MPDAFPHLLGGCGRSATYLPRQLIVPEAKVAGPAGTHQFALNERAILDGGRPASRVQFEDASVEAAAFPDRAGQVDAIIDEGNAFMARMNLPSASTKFQAP